MGQEKEPFPGTRSEWVNSVPTLHNYKTVFWLLFSFKTLCFIHSWMKKNVLTSKQNFNSFWENWHLVTAVHIIISKAVIIRYLFLQVSYMHTIYPVLNSWSPYIIVRALLQRYILEWCNTCNM
jgi:hypothetical protein